MQKIKLWMIQIAPAMFSEENKVSRKKIKNM